MNTLLKFLKRQQKKTNKNTKTTETSMNIRNFKLQCRNKKNAKSFRCVFFSVHRLLRFFVFFFLPRRNGYYIKMSWAEDEMKWRWDSKKMGWTSKNCENRNLNHHNSPILHVCNNMLRFRLHCCNLQIGLFFCSFVRMFVLFVRLRPLNANVNAIFVPLTCKMVYSFPITVVRCKIVVSSK